MTILFKKNGHGVVAAKADINTGIWRRANTICSDLVLNGFSDWRLPTTEELEMMYLQKSALGPFATSYLGGCYWSSREMNALLILGVDFNNGGQVRLKKISTCNLRPVRDF